MCEELNECLKNGEELSEELMRHVAEMGAQKAIIPVTCFVKDKLLIGKITVEINQEA